MAIKLKIPRASGGKSLLPRDPIVRAALLVFLIVSAAVVGVFSYYYVTYGRIIDKRFSGAVFSNSAKIYAIPKTVRVGEKIDAHQIAAEDYPANTCRPHQAQLPRNPGGTRRTGNGQRGAR